MFLLIAATDMELEPLQGYSSNTPGVTLMVSGVGPVETAYTVSRYLAENYAVLRGVINFGVAGAYVGMASMLDICVAETEIFGDFGVLLQDDIVGFEGSGLQTHNEVDLRNAFYHECLGILETGGVHAVSGNFVTVACVSGTASRGVLLMNKYRGVCENMEGFAIARACQGFRLPFFEMRCVSNMVEDRNRAAWKLIEARDKCIESVTILLSKLI